MIKRVCLITFKQELRFSPDEERFKCYLMDFANRDWHLTRRILGSGSFASVFLARGKVPTDQVACKVVDLVHSRKLQAQEVWMREVEILRRVSHPNITQARQILLTKEHAFIVTDLISAGDLFSYVHSRLLYGPHRIADAERQIAWITWQVLKSVEYLHRRNIVHRDIKLENVLVADPRPYGRVLLADFGMACDLTMKQSSSAGIAHATYSTPNRMNSRVGTAAYQAPEMLCSRISTHKHIQGHDYGPEVDLWSLGCLIHEMVLGYSPFTIAKTDNVDEITRKTMNEDLSFENVPVQQLTTSVRDLLLCLLERNPKSRMTIRSAYVHPWLSQHNDVFVTLHKKIFADWVPAITVVKDLDSIPELVPACDITKAIRDQQPPENGLVKVQKKRPRLIDLYHTDV
ncbi:Meiosis-specific serine/threonine-protein kinase mek1 [Taphrina deformans PYCC 5710]|uniref:Meiosis-specific serine/threonine-protein kinase mek1 n=1 Tax=Taphrina deformans (strain PYCC 5710 / ATCC 11124 / CBS 356.35 / IMI 108563 / JCM 9778 / NBRC 8474) TaxID=1097556 RepID=R4X7I5_TAPDE|nr:Meiosis-specific serine/threonine-protein kinase mek1 [Taphrina deformans PYCC 5710]|eukprot:CCG81063.1 Meiosis-specific serine/threonine-protein kinase mek1 [Taphrina deformans PYCC 5710]